MREARLVVDNEKTIDDLCSALTGTAVWFTIIWSLSLFVFTVWFWRVYVRLDAILEVLAQ